MYGFIEPKSRIPCPPKPKKDREVHIPVDIDTEKLDESIKKAKELVELLREANELIHSL